MKFGGISGISQIGVQKCKIRVQNTLPNQGEPTI